MWAEILGRGAVGVDDDFFALGGDSFQAVRAVRDIDPGCASSTCSPAPPSASWPRYLDGGSRASGRAAAPPRRAAPRAELTVVCVPYGGGSAAAYRPLAPSAPRLAGHGLLAVELPGHDPARPDETAAADGGAGRPARRRARRDRSRPAASVRPLRRLGRRDRTGAAAGGAAARGSPALVVGGSFPAARLPGRLSAWCNRQPPRRPVDLRPHLPRLAAHARRPGETSTTPRPTG